MRLTVCSITCLLTLTLFAQNKAYYEGFAPPLDVPLILAGTFGELRSNHFHAGIDLKTQQREGLPVYAVENGTVTRIKISHWGYGKAMYIAHPTGHTSVYAHLQKFAPEIEAYIKNLQYKKRSYEIEVFPEFGDLEVSKGELIAYSGNTGSSAGPHLHFEIRNSVNATPTNPLLYGYEVRDATNPILTGLYAYPLSESAHVNQSAQKIQINYTRQADGSFLADKVKALGTIGFGFSGFDQQDMAANKNGIYSIEQQVNGKLTSAIYFDAVSFEETRYINTYIDYEHFAKNKQRIQKCFKEESNKLGIYKELYSDGKIEVAPDLNYKVTLTLSDMAGNQTKLVIPVEGVELPITIAKEPVQTPYLVYATKPASFDLGLVKAYFPENTFYEDVFLDLKKGADTVQIHNDNVSAHRNFTLTFDVSTYSTEERKQMFIALLDERSGQPIYTNTYKKGQTFNTRTRNFGTYTLAVDSIAPTIKPRNFRPKDWLSNYRYLSIEIEDDLSGIGTYEAFLNGQWILMEYEPKKKTLTYNFDDAADTETQCELQVTVTDNVGNTTTFETTFFRK